MIEYFNYSLQAFWVLFTFFMIVLQKVKNESIILWSSICTVNMITVNIRFSSEGGQLYFACTARIGLCLRRCVRRMSVCAACGGKQSESNWRLLMYVMYNTGVSTMQYAVWSIRYVQQCQHRSEQCQHCLCSALICSDLLYAVLRLHLKTDRETESHSVDLDTWFHSWIILDSLLPVAVEVATLALLHWRSSRTRAVSQRSDARQCNPSLTFQTILQQCLTFGQTVKFSTVYVVNEWFKCPTNALQCWDRSDPFRCITLFWILIWLRLMLDMITTT